VLFVIEQPEFQEPWVHLVGLGPAPELLRSVLVGPVVAGLRGGEGSAWQRSLRRLGSWERLLVDLSPNLASGHPLWKESVLITGLLPEK